MLCHAIPRPSYSQTTDACSHVQYSKMGASHGSLRLHKESPRTQMGVESQTTARSLYHGHEYASRTSAPTWKNPSRPPIKSVETGQSWLWLSGQKHTTPRLEPESPALEDTLHLEIIYKIASLVLLNPDLDGFTERWFSQ